MKARDLRGPAVVALLLIAIVVMAFNRGTGDGLNLPKAGFNDGSPLGGKALRMLLEHNGYVVKRVAQRQSTMPADAKVWLLLDPGSSFSKVETDALLGWVRAGGTLIWASSEYSAYGEQLRETSASHQAMAKTFGVQPVENSLFFQSTDDLLPKLTPLKMQTASVYRTGVKSASGSSDCAGIARAHIEIAGVYTGSELARIDIGKGHVIVAPDALSFTNYALADRGSNNAELVTNLVRVHAKPGQGAVYFDERELGEMGDSKFEANLLYYLWRPPLRWALLQLALACLLVWTCFGVRLGAAVPLPGRQPVTRASQFAIAMGSLFRKVNRPRAAAAIVGEEFRRTVARRLGMSISDSDRALAQRAADMSGLPVSMIDRLLLRGRNPAEDEASALADAQEMEIVMRRLSL